uniref:Uncharacterized protein n=1 Tax=Plectus sambesii TaxID=2011161 RepID=A0A914V4Y3_9BILA
MSVGSMDEKRAFFEHLYGTHEIPLIMGPPKPVRTFEHDIYEEQKALRLRSQAPTLVVCRPTVPVKPARRKKVPAADKIEDPLAPDPPDVSRFVLARL